MCLEIKNVFFLFLLSTKGIGKLFLHLKRPSTHVKFIKNQSCDFNFNFGCMYVKRPSHALESFWHWKETVSRNL